LFKSRSICDRNTSIDAEGLMGMKLWTDQKFLDGILDFEAEGSWLKMTREVAVQSRLELR
jgi:hypothetical protein